MAISASSLAPASKPWVRIDALVDGSLTASTAAVTLLVDHIVKSGMQEAPSCPQDTRGVCKVASLSGFDRFSVHFDDASWRHISDWTQWAAILGGALVVGVDAASAHPMARGVRVSAHLLVYTKAIFLSQAVALGTKMAVRRPRPAAYNRPTTRFEDLQSFPSAHTSVAAATSMAAAGLYVLRHASRAQRRMAYACAFFLITMTASGRVLGGQHFLSDVIAGAAIGITVALTVVRSHARISLSE